MNIYINKKYYYKVEKHLLACGNTFLIYYMLKCKAISGMIIETEKIR